MKLECSTEAGTEIGEAGAGFCGGLRMYCALGGSDGGEPVSPVDSVSGIDDGMLDGSRENKRLGSVGGRGGLCVDCVLVGCDGAELVSHVDCSRGVDDGMLDRSRDSKRLGGVGGRGGLYVDYVLG